MESLAEINLYSVLAFEQWLEARLKAQYSEDPDVRYSASDFREAAIPLGESHIDSFIGLSRKLSIAAQSSFVEGLEQLLRHAQPDSFPAEGMADIVLLLGLLRAHTALASFVPVFGSGPWGELHPFLIYDSLSVLLMFDRSTEAYEAAKGLATSVNFPDAYVFDAFKVLVRCRPQEWLADFELLRERFSRIRENTLLCNDQTRLAQLVERERDLVDSLSEAIPLSEIGKQLPKLELTPGRSSYAHPHVTTDRWLLNRFFQPAGPLKLKCSIDDDHLVIVDRSNIARRGSVQRSSPLDVVFMAGGLIDLTGDTIPLRKLNLSEKALRIMNNVSPKRDHGWYEAAKTSESVNE